MAAWPEGRGGHKKERAEIGRAAALVAALLGEGWPHTLPLCLAAGVARAMGWERVEVPFLGLTRAEARWACIGGTALARAGLARALLWPWGMELLPGEGAWRLLPWGWVVLYVGLVARRSLWDGWQVVPPREGHSGTAGRLLLRRDGRVVRLLCGPLGRGRRGDPEGEAAGAVVSPLPWHDRLRATLPVLSPPEVGRWLAEALAGSTPRS